MIDNTLLELINNAAQPIFSFLKKHLGSKQATNFEKALNLFIFNAQLTEEIKLSCSRELYEYFDKIATALEREKSDSNGDEVFEACRDKLFLYLAQIEPLKMSNEPLDKFAVGRSPCEQTQQIFSYSLDVEKLNKKLIPIWYQQQKEPSNTITLATTPFKEPRAAVSPQTTLCNTHQQRFWPTASYASEIINKAPPPRANPIKLHTTPFKQETYVSCQELEKSFGNS